MKALDGKTLESRAVKRILSAVVSPRETKQTLVAAK
jgi:hypothetical protein